MQASLALEVSKMQIAVDAVAKTQKNIGSSKPSARLFKELSREREARRPRMNTAVHGIHGAKDENPDRAHITKKTSCPTRALYAPSRLISGVQNNTVGRPVKKVVAYTDAPSTAPIARQNRGSRRRRRRTFFFKIITGIILCLRHSPYDKGYNTINSKILQ
jgi:hypothetical protein